MSNRFTAVNPECFTPSDLQRLAARESAIKAQEAVSPQITRQEAIQRCVQLLEACNFNAILEFAASIEADYPVIAVRARAAARNKAVQKVPAEGYYTVILNGDDNYITFRIIRQEAKASFAPGQLLIQRLVGADNTRNYCTVAFAPEGHRRLAVFKKQQDDKRLVRALVVLVSGPEEAGAAYALKSGRCRRCGRMLTVPASLHAGYGPDCWSRMSP